MPIPCANDAILIVHIPYPDTRLVSLNPLYGMEYIIWAKGPSRSVQRQHKGKKRNKIEREESIQQNWLRQQPAAS